MSRVGLLSNKREEEMNDAEKLKIVQQGIKDVLMIQGYDGNWNYNPYMLGLYNGFLLADVIANGGEYKPRSAPKLWGYQRARINKILFFWRRDKVVSDDALDLSSIMRNLRSICE